MQSLTIALTNRDQEPPLVLDAKVLAIAYIQEEEGREIGFGSLVEGNASAVDLAGLIAAIETQLLPTLKTEMADILYRSHSKMPPETLKDLIHSIIQAKGETDGNPE